MGIHFELNHDHMKYKRKILYCHNSQSFKNLGITAKQILYLFDTYRRYRVFENYYSFIHYSS
jgi:hypothetical protein